MRDNWHLALSGPRVLLVPYRARHVACYHAWMQSEALLAATASEPLSLADEYAMQRDWRDDPRKCTFIITAHRPPPSSPPLRPSTAAAPAGPAAAGPAEHMVGDTNFFFNDHDDPSCAEIEIMIAEPAYRRQGLATEALHMMMAYGVHALGVGRFVAKIGYDNAASLALFTSPALGFRVFERHDWCEETHCELVVRDAVPRVRGWGRRTFVLPHVSEDGDGGQVKADAAVATMLQQHWFWVRIEALASPRDVSALGLVGKVPRSLCGVRRAGLARVMARLNAMLVEEGEKEPETHADNVSDSSDEPVPNPNFSGLGLFERDSMWFVDLAGGEMQFNGVPVFCRDDPKGNTKDSLGPEQDTGHITWDGAIMLAKYLERRHAVSSLMAGTTILELGAGTGFVGLACAALGAKRVFLTDLAYALPIASQNLARNVAAGSMQAVGGAEEKTAGGGGGRNGDGSGHHPVCRVAVRELDWCTRGEDWPVSEVGAIDLILGADVIWQRALAAPLAATLSSLLKRAAPHARALLLYTSRYGDDFDEFVASTLTDAGLCVGTVPREGLDPTYSFEEGEVWEISLDGARGDRGEKE